MVREVGDTCFPSSRAGRARMLHAAVRWWCRPTVMRLHAQLVRDLECIEQLQCGREQRRFLLVRGLAGAQDICAISVLRSPWPIYPSLCLPLSSHIRSSGRIRCSSFSSVWKRSPSNSNASGEPQSVEELWKEYFADPTRWWDLRADKRNARSPAFRHKVATKALWIDDWSTPPWVKAMLNLATDGKMQAPVDYRSRDSQGRTQRDRLSKGHNGKRRTAPTTARESTHNDGGMPMESARSTIEGISTLKNRLERGLAIHSYMYVEVLRRCLKEESLGVDVAKQVHDYINQSGLEQNRIVANNLMSVYIRCGELEGARGVFDKFVNKNVFSWTIMIGGYAKQNHTEKAMELFNEMFQKGVQPDAVTFLIMLKACADPSALQWGKEVHAYVRHAGLESDVRMSNTLVHMYANCGSIDDARLVFGRMKEHNVISWNLMIGGLAEHGFGQEAYELFLQMLKEGFKPDAFTYASILNPCASAGALEWVKDVHRHVVNAGLESDLRLGTVLVHMYANTGSLDDARLLFDRMEDRDVITWNVMIGGLAQHGCGRAAYELLLKMKQEGLDPDTITYLSILNPCASVGALEWVKDVYRLVLEAGFESDLRLGNALVHMYAKSGSLDDARLVFDRMEDRDVITWNVMIGGLADHGCGHEALEVFKNMIADGVKPNEISFVAVLSACSHAGLVDEGRRLFWSMTHDYGIEPSVELCTCMVDCLGRAGHLEEAKLLIDNMPVEPNGATWGALLGACRTYGNVELGKLAANELLKLKPKDASAYVLLSNICAAAGKWEEVLWVRTMMQERGVRKEPGRSWIEVDNKVHDFVVGDTSHPEAKEIYAELRRLSERIKAEGYIPDTRLVLRNIDEEEKELALCSHSEKLAIAYGLMRTPPGEAIRVFKNLRVCSDCHTATKFISKATEREIVVRDANRFHHFRDGVCSCGDYW